MNAVRRKFEAWVVVVRVLPDLRYDEDENCYVYLDTEWLWLAFHAGYNTRKQLR